MRILANVLLLLVFVATGSFAAETILHADFQDKAVDQPIGTGGPDLGEPVSVSSAITAIVRDTPMPTRCLAITDNADGVGSGADFEFVGSTEVTSGIVHIAADLWFPEFENTFLFVREQGSSAETFASIRFSPDGNVRISDEADPIPQVVGAYAAGRLFPVEIVYDMDARTYDMILDGATVIDGRSHGVVSRGVGSVIFGVASDADSSGTINVDNIHVWTEPGVRALVGHFDVKPGSCPNPLNVKNLLDEPKNGRSNRGGVLPVALLGGEDFDVRDVDLSTVTLEGVAPLRASHEDVGAPGGRPKDECECETTEPDGYMDLTLKFDKEDLVDKLGEVYDGDHMPLTLTGQLNDGTRFEDFDCVLIRGHARPDEPNDERKKGDSGNVVLKAAHPNPFNPATTIAFTIAEGARVRLDVYDVNGRHVRTLVDGYRAADTYEITWEGRDDAGRVVTSGVYFYRLVAGNVARTKRMVLLK